MLSSDNQLVPVEREVIYVDKADNLLDRVRNSQVQKTDTDGILDLWRVFVQKLTASANLRAELEIAREMEENRHQMAVLQTEHIQKEREQSYNGSLILRVESVKKFIETANEISNMLRGLGLSDDRASEIAERYILNALETTGLTLIANDIPQGMMKK